MSVTVKWGLITGMVYVIFSLISNMLGIQQGGGGASAGLGMLMNIVIMVVTFFTMYLGIKESRDIESGGYLTMGQAFKKGMAIAAIAGLIAGVFTFIYMKFIDPEMSQRILEGAEDQWDQMNVPEEQREMSRKITGIFLNPSIMAPFMILWVAFWAIFKSLVAGAILKRDAPPTIPTV
jgi:predicted histidine transporter YuiF (NhaC family)